MIRAYICAMRQVEPKSSSRQIWVLIYSLSDQTFTVLTICQEPLDDKNKKNGHNIEPSLQIAQANTTLNPKHNSHYRWP